MPNFGLFLADKFLDRFDPATGHQHNGTDAAKVLWTNLLTTGAAIQNGIRADGAGGVVVSLMYNGSECDFRFPAMDYGYTVAETTVDNASETELSSVTIVAAVSSSVRLIRAFCLLKTAHVWASDGTQTIEFASTLYRGVTSLDTYSAYVAYKDQVQSAVGSRAQTLYFPFQHWYLDGVGSGLDTYKHTMQATAAYDVRLASRRSIEVLQIK